MDNRERAEKIRLIAFDVDGTLTDASIMIGEYGEAVKRFNAKDGLGLAAARRAGFKLALITGRRSALLERRAAELGINEVWQGIEDKRETLLNLCEKFTLGLSEIAYMGDDLNDLPALTAAGFAAAPADAVKDVRDAAHYVASLPGGRGAAREIIEYILAAQGKWADVVNSYREKGWARQ